jgi:hypothetical protein
MSIDELLGLLFALTLTVGYLGTVILFMILAQLFRVGAEQAGAR